MTLQEIQQIISNGEDSHTEFKTDDVHPDALAGEFVAFANVDGGRVLVGVSDDGSIMGVRKKNFEDTIVQICRQNCHPPIIPIIDKIKIENRLVISVYIPKSPEVHRTNKGQYYLRIGSTKQLATTQELSRLLRQRSFFFFDDTIVQSANINDLDYEKINVYLNKLGQNGIEKSLIGEEKLLCNLKIMQEIDGKYYPTVAGLLVFGKNPNYYLPQSSVEMAYYKGTKQSIETIDSFSSQGTIPEQIEQVVNFVKKNMKVASLTLDIKRDERPDYHLLAIREAITNAVAHRDYSIAGTGIRVLMFSNRIEFISPGGLPNTLTLENIKTVQFARNPVIVSFLHSLRYIEKRGEGIRKIILWSKENDAPPPKWSLPDPNLFKLVLFKRKSRKNSHNRVPK